MLQISERAITVIKNHLTTFSISASMYIVQFTYIFLGFFCILPLNISTCCSFEYNFVLLLNCGHDW